MGEEIEKEESWANSVEFGSQAEVLAFVKGVGYQKDENVDSLSLSYFASPPNKTGKFSISVRVEPRQGVLPPCAE